MQEYYHPKIMTSNLVVVQGSSWLLQLLVSGSTYLPYSESSSTTFTFNLTFHKEIISVNYTVKYVQCIKFVDYITQPSNSRASFGRPPEAHTSKMVFHISFRHSGRSVRVSTTAIHIQGGIL